MEGLSTYMENNFTPRTDKNVMSFFKVLPKNVSSCIDPKNPDLSSPVATVASQAPSSSCSYTISRAFTSLVDRESFLKDRGRHGIESMFSDLGFFRCDHFFTEDIVNDKVLLQVLCSLASVWSVYFDLFNTYKTFQPRSRRSMMNSARENIQLTAVEVVQILSEISDCKIGKIVTTKSNNTNFPEKRRTN